MAQLLRLGATLRLTGFLPPIRLRWLCPRNVAAHALQITNWRGQQVEASQRFREMGQLTGISPTYLLTSFETDDWERPTSLAISVPGDLVHAVQSHHRQAI